MIKKIRTINKIIIIIDISHLNENRVHNLFVLDL